MYGLKTSQSDLESLTGFKGVTTVMENCFEKQSDLKNYISAENDKHH